MVAAFSLFFFAFSLHAQAQAKEYTNKHIDNEDAATMPKESKSKFDANEVIFGHVLDAHQFHFFSYQGKDGLEHHATIP